MLDPDVVAFLTLEARLMDESRYAEWLALWTADARYWVPCNDDDIDPAKHISIIYDDFDRLTQRVERLLSGSVLAVQPRPRMRRVIANIEISELSAATATVESNFILASARLGKTQMWIGRSIHTLERIDGAFKMSGKKVLLIDNDQEIPLLQFII